MKKLKPIYIVIFSAVIIGVISMLPSIMRYGVFLSKADFIEQQLPFLMEIKRMLQTGTPFWSWNSVLGGNFISTYSFYLLGSPFTLILMLFPITYMAQGLTIVILLKFVVCAIFAYLFLKRFCKKEKSAVIGAILYTFSGFTIVNTQFQFLDTIALFPLLLLALEKVFCDKKKTYGILAISIAVNISTNFYLAVSTAVFTIIYMILRLKEWDIKSVKNWIQFFIEGILGVALTAIILIPTILTMLELPRINISLDNAMTMYYFPTTILERIRVLFMPIESGVVHSFYSHAFSWTSTAAYLPMFGMVFVCLYMAKNKKSWITKIILISIVISLVSVANGAFSMFTNYNYTRWWYGLALMLALATALVIDNLEQYKKSEINKSFWGNIIFILAITVPFVIIYYLHINGVATITRYDEHIGGTKFILYSYILTVINFIALYITLKKKKYAIILLIIVAGINYASFNKLNEDIEFDSHLDYYYVRCFLHNTKENDNVNYSYRTIYPDETVANYSAYSNEPGISGFNSIINRNTQLFYVATNSAYRNDVSISVNEEYREKLYALLSVKYYKRDVLDTHLTLPEDLTFIEEKNGAEIYENKNYVPFGFAYNEYIFESNVILEREKILDYALNAIILPADANVAGLSKATEIKDWREAVKDRQKNTCENFEGTSQGFTANIKLDKPNYVFFSVPYDKGWKAYVNGKEASIVRANIGFMAVLAEEGDNYIEFKYEVPGLKIGILISGISLLLLGTYIIMRKRIEARKDF